MGLAELLLLAVGLAMDAFAVSVCGSMVLIPDNRLRGALRFGSWFGAFQFFDACDRLFRRCIVS